MASKKILVDIDVDGSVESTSFIKSGGTSAQFLKADGSVDTTTYLASTSLPDSDNYQSWNLKTNGTQRKTIQSGNDLDLVAGTNIALSYSAGGVVTIDSAEVDTLATVTGRTNGATTTTESSFNGGLNTNKLTIHDNASNLDYKFFVGRTATQGTGIAVDDTGTTITTVQDETTEPYNHYLAFNIVTQTEGTPYYRFRMNGTELLRIEEDTTTFENDIQVNGNITADNYLGNWEGKTPQDMLWKRAYSHHNGMLVRLDIAENSNQMFQVFMRANGYGTYPIQVHLQGYNYIANGSILSVRANTTNYDSPIYAFHYSGYVYVWLEDTANNQTWEFFATTFSDNYNKIVSITNTVKPTSGITDEVQASILKSLDSSDISGITKGSGTLNYLSKWTSSADTLTDSIIYDDGTNVGIGSNSPNSKLHVVGEDSGVGGIISEFRNSNNANRIEIRDEDLSQPPPTPPGIYSPTASLGLGLYAAATSAPIRFHAGGVSHSDEKMRITHDGKVGIGTAIPSAPLSFGKVAYGEPSSEDFYRIKFKDLGGVNNDVGIGQPDAQSLGFNVGQGTITFNRGTSGESMRIASNGNVGIGTADPYQAKLVVDGDIAIPRSNSLVFLETISGAFRAKISSQDSNPYNGLEFFTGSDASTVKMVIEDDGNVGIGTASPSANLHVEKSNYVYLRLSGTDGGSFPAETVLLSIDGFGGRGAGIRIRDSVNSTTNPSDRTWYMGSGYGKPGFGINYSADGSQQSYSSNTKLYISTDGDVGIGTTSPEAKLDVSATSNATIRLSSSSANQQGQAIGKIDFYSADTSTPGAGVKSSITTYVESESSAEGDASSMAFSTSSGVVNNVERVRIDKNGNVGIGISSPSSKLEVDGNIVVTQNLTGSRKGIKINSLANSNRSGGVGVYKINPVNGDFVNSHSFTTGGSSGNEFTNPSFTIRHTFGSTIGTSLSEVDTDFMHTSTATGVPTSAVRIMGQTGNVGVGTTSPNSKLELAGGQLHINNKDTGGGLKLGSGYTSELYMDSSDRLLHNKVNSSLAKWDWLSSNSTAMELDYNGNLTVYGGVKIADDTDAASSDKVGTIRYRTSGNNSYVDMCMQTGTSTYEWVNITQNNW